MPLQETNTISHQTGSWENHRLNRDMLVPGGGGVYIRILIEFDRLIDWLVVSFYIPC